LPGQSWKVDLHLHSRFSHDSRTQLEDLVARCAEVGLDRIALTDHNTAEGALKLQELAPELAIVGEEVKTTEGEVIGLFITRSIRPWQRAEEVMDQVHEMGGLVYLPHPFDRWRSHFLPERVVRLAERIDVIEAYNPWCDAGANLAAEEMARDLGKPVGCGSDAHAASELGHSWLEIEPFTSPAEFLERLPRAALRRTAESGSHRRG